MSAIVGGRKTFFRGRWIVSVGLGGLQIIWAQKRGQSEFYFNAFYFWIYFPVARRWWMPQQSSQLLSVRLDYVWTQSFILSKTQLMRREMKSASRPSVFVVICDTFTPLFFVYSSPLCAGSPEKGADKWIHWLTAKDVVGNESLYFVSIVGSNWGTVHLYSKMTGKLILTKHLFFPIISQHIFH